VGPSLYLKFEDVYSNIQIHKNAHNCKTYVCTRIYLLRNIGIGFAGLE